MVMYIENLRMFSVKFLELMCEGNYVVKKRSIHRNQLFFSSTTNDRKSNFKKVSKIV